MKLIVLGILIILNNISFALLPRFFRGNSYKFDRYLSNMNEIDTNPPKAISCFAAARNKGPILEILKKIVDSTEFNKIPCIKVLEIASGTGEHASYFCSEVSNLLYLPTYLNSEVESKWRQKYSPDEQPQNSYDMKGSIEAWTDLSREQLSNKNSDILPPIQLDVEDFDVKHLPNQMAAGTINLLICINMIHITPFSCTVSLFKLASQILDTGGVVLTYGPYKINNFMVESNIAFDLSLKARNSEWGIRAVEDVEKVANSYNIVLETKYEMPANNLCLAFRKV